VHAHTCLFAITAAIFLAHNKLPEQQLVSEQLTVVLPAQADQPVQSQPLDALPFASTIPRAGVVLAVLPVFDVLPVQAAA
ncbi:hypothetical protein A2U01_0006807, partial [Trifolium medium]|nr:hypothetical protein [Trifolium medium]